jgi:hypothetical protein
LFIGAKLCINKGNHDPDYNVKNEKKKRKEKKKGKERKDKKKRKEKGKEKKKKKKRKQEKRKKHLFNESATHTAVSYINRK